MRGRAGRTAAALAVLIGLGPGFEPAAPWSVARAAAEKPAATIAILPLAAPDRRLEIYGKPVADALAQELGARLKPGFTIEALSDGSAVPARVDLVIDGRIVARAAGNVSLEAQVRDPERGTRMGHAATEAAALNRIDELARKLAARLAGPVDQAMAEKRRLARQPIVMPETVIEIARGRDGAGMDAGQARGQALVVFDAMGQAADGAVPVTRAATRAGYEMAAALGFRPVPAQPQGLLSVDRAVAAMRRHRARYGLMIDVKDIDFAWYGVLAARGRFRVLLIDAQGRVFHDRIHRTGTLVGSRGDRHAALVRLVMDQARDIAVPELSASMVFHEQKQPR
jgi:hypothetical protein